MSLRLTSEKGKKQRDGLRTVDIGHPEGRHGPSQTALRHSRPSFARACNLQSAGLLGTKRPKTSANLAGCPRADRHSFQPALPPRSRARRREQAREQARVNGLNAAGAACTRPFSIPMVAGTTPRSRKTAFHRQGLKMPCHHLPAQCLHFLCGLQVLRVRPLGSKVLPCYCHATGTLNTLNNMLNKLG